MENNIISAEAIISIINSRIDYHKQFTKDLMVSIKGGDVNSVLSKNEQLLRSSIAEAELNMLLMYVKQENNKSV